MSTPIPPSEVDELRAARLAYARDQTPERRARLFRAIDAVLGDNAEESPPEASS